MRHLRFFHISILVALVVGTAARAEAYIELNGFYFSDAVTTATTSTNTRMFVEASVGFAVDKKNRYLVGWNYSMISTSDASTATTTYSASHMGPRFIYSIDKNMSWSLGLGYYLVSQATYDSGTGTSVTWKGSAIKFDIGYNFPATENLNLGLRFNYLSATYGEQLVGATTYSTVSYTRASMYPSLYAIYLF